MALREMGPESRAAIPALAQLVRDPDGYVRISAAHTLEKMGAAAVPALASLLRDRDYRVRELAAETLRSIGQDAKAAVPALADALRDENPGVRDAAAMALREMGPEAKAAIPALAQLARDPDGYVRITAAHTLERMGTDAVPSLVPLLRDPDARVREARGQQSATDPIRHGRGRFGSRPLRLQLYQARSVCRFHVIRGPAGPTDGTRRVPATNEAAFSPLFGEKHARSAGLYRIFVARASSP